MRPIIVIAGAVIAVSYAPWWVGVIWLIVAVVEVAVWYRDRADR